jgi:hypothetical protein
VFELLSSLGHPHHLQTLPHTLRPPLVRRLIWALVHHSGSRNHLQRGLDLAEAALENDRCTPDQARELKYLSAGGVWWEEGSLLRHRWGALVVGWQSLRLRLGADLRRLGWLRDGELGRGRACESPTAWG